MASSVPLARVQVAGWAKGLGDHPAWKPGWQEESGGGQMLSVAVFPLLQHQGRLLNVPSLR